MSVLGVVVPVSIVVQPTLCIKPLTGKTNWTINLVRSVLLNCAPGLIAGRPHDGSMKIDKLAWCAQVIRDHVIHRLILQPTEWCEAVRIEEPTGLKATVLNLMNDD